jgi:hypothetical protein
MDAHEFAAVFAASQRKFGAGKRNLRFPNIPLFFSQQK